MELAVTLVMVYQCHLNLFIINSTNMSKQEQQDQQPTKSTTVLPHNKGISEVLRHYLRQGIWTIFKSDTTLRSHLVQPKDTLEPTKQVRVVYNISCECGKVYIGQTGRSKQERIKERDIWLARTHLPVSAHNNKINYVIFTHLNLWITMLMNEM